MIVLYFIFMAAYVNSNKSTCIDINNYNEANPEVIIVHLQLILSVLGTIVITLFRPRKPKNETTILNSRLASA